MYYTIFVLGVFMKQDAKIIASSIWACMTKIAVRGPAFCGVLMLPVLPAYGRQQSQQPSQQPQQQVRQQLYPELPADTGKDTLIRVCSKCHSPDNVIANGQNLKGWENTITKMASFGAVGTDDEFTAILDYLVKNFPPGSGGTVNVNKATAAQLESGLGLSTTEAEAIIQYREKNGAFKSIKDLEKVPDLDSNKLDAEKTRLAF